MSTLYIRKYNDDGNYSNGGLRRTKDGICKRGKWVAWGVLRESNVSPRKCYIDFWRFQGILMDSGVSRSLR